MKKIEPPLLFSKISKTQPPPLSKGGRASTMLDLDNNGGGLKLFVREDIQCKLLSVENHPMEGFYVEIKLRKTRCLLCCSYNPHRCKIDFHLENLN